MKNELKKLALVLSAVLLLSSVMVYGAAPVPALLTGTGTVTNPTFSVLLPTAPVIRLNPLQLGSEGQNIMPQIDSANLVVANRSNVPVRVQVAVGTHTVAAPNNAHFVATSTAIGGFGTSRAAFLTVRWATGAALSGTFLGNTPIATLQNAADWGFQTTGSAITSSGAVMTASNVESVHTFYMLLAAQHTTVNAGVVTISAGAIMADEQYTAFRFGGAVNPSATWAANQVAARVVFTVTALAPLTFDETVNLSSPAAIGHRVYSQVTLAAVGG